ncbi:amino acid adenylation domain-containing protein, partial [Francisellaceae bacterium]|nr:amino acid adenylation domain-containing protein [Francisellaceae bacterium]
QEEGELLTIPKALTKKYYPLSFAQERLWFIEQYEQGTNAYHIPMFFKASSQINEMMFSQAIEYVINRHEVLRSLFEQDANGVDVQVVCNEPLHIQTYIFDSIDALEEQAAKDIDTPFNLRNEYPIRASWYTNKENGSQYALINMHHIASDGWAIDILQRELLASFNNQQETLPQLTIQYKDFAEWQKSYLQGEVLEQQLSYWKHKLEGMETLELPTDKERPHRFDYKGAILPFELDQVLSRQLRSLAKQQGVSLYSVLISAFYVLLHKYSGQDDIIIGSPIANRHYSQVQDLVGFFVNTLVMRQSIDPEQSILKLIEQVRADISESQRYQDIPFEKIVGELNIIRDESRHPLFQVSFRAQSFSSEAQAKEFNQYLDAEPLRNEQTAKFDLDMLINDGEDQLKGVIEYATSLFAPETIERLKQHYLNVLEQLITSPNQAIKDIQILSKEEYQTIIYDWNDTDKAYPKDKTIYQLFEEQVTQTPNNIAVVYEETQLTYQELNEHSNQLARVIRAEYKNSISARQSNNNKDSQERQHKLQPDTLIALCLDRSEQMIISILAVLKAGAAYVPLDPSYPEDRIEYILSDTQAPLLLTQSNHADKLHNLIKDNDLATQVIDLSETSVNTNIHTQDKSNLTPQSQSTDLAYVIYTSGTTGKPKGVLVEHRGVSNLISSLLNSYSINKNERFVLFAQYVFDASIEQMFLAFSSGSNLYIPDGDIVKDVKLFIDFVIKNRITHLHATPSYFELCDFKKLPDNLRIVFGAEHVPIEVFKKYDAHFKTIINEYGPTETTITSLIGLNTHSIGNELGNTYTYILDPQQQPVPIGVVGELYIGGAGLARGYLNRPELTAERFIPNPFATESDIQKGYTRLYKTGDLVRWLADGNLEYIGRNDFQVKIRGFRIELGEIENTLSTHPAISQVCVLAKDRQSSGNDSTAAGNSNGNGTDKLLVAYYVPEGVTNLNIENNDLESALISHCNDSLPEYMVPSFFVALEAFPLTINGKLDRQALPDPDVSANQDHYVAPETVLQAELC